MSKIKYNEVVHQWEGIAIVRSEEGLKEIPLGVIGSKKRLTEVGAKDLFTNVPNGTITVEVKKNCDVISTYEMDSEDFKKVAKLVGTPTEEQAESETVEPEQVESE